MTALIHRSIAALLLPLLLWLCWSGTLSLYRTELDLLSIGWPAAYAKHLATAVPLQTPSQDGIKGLAKASPKLNELQAALTVAAQQTPALDTLYIEFSNARQPLTTLHWQTRQTPGLHRQYLWMIAPSQADQQLRYSLIGPSRLQSFGPDTGLTGSWFFALHYQLLGLFGRAGQAIALLGAVAMLWLCGSGLYLCVRHRQRLVSALLGRMGTPQALGRGALRWHWVTGLVSLPFVLWFFGSAFMVQLGNWPPNVLKDSRVDQATFFQSLYPWPNAPVAPAAKTAVQHDLQGIAESVAALMQHVEWPVGKVQLDLNQGTVLLTQGSHAQWAADNPQLQQQSFTLAGDKLSQAPYSASPLWRLRNLGYALHQAAFVSPWGRALLFLAGTLATLMLLLAAKRLSRTKLQACWFHGMTTAPVVVSLAWLVHLWLGSYFL